MLIYLNWYVCHLKSQIRYTFSKSISSVNQIMWFKYCREEVTEEEWRQAVSEEEMAVNEAYQEFTRQLEDANRKKERFKQELSETMRRQDEMKKKHPVLWRFRSAGLAVAGAIVGLAGIITSPIWLPPVIAFKIIDD